MKTPHFHCRGDTGSILGGGAKILNAASKGQYTNKYIKTLGEKYRSGQRPAYYRKELMEVKGLKMSMIAI